MRKPFIKVIRNTVREHWVLTALLAVSIILTLIAGVLPPLLLEEVVNRLAAKEEIPLLLTLSYFGLLVVAGIFEAIREALITVFGEKTLHHLRSALIEKTERLNASYFYNHDSGALVSLFVSDVDTIETLFNSGVISIIADSFTLISIIAVVFTRSIGLGILLCIATPFLFLLTRYAQKEMLAAQKENRKAVSDATKILPETFRNKRTIHNLNAEDFMEKRYDESILRSYKSLEKSNFFDSIYSPVILISSALIVAIMMSLSSLGGIWRDLFGMSVGTATALISYVNKVFSPLESIGMEIQNIQSAMAGITRINAFLEEEEKENAVGKVCNDFPENAIQVEDLSFGYEESHPVLNHFNCTVKTGESVVVIGRTGAGKSTLFKLLLGLYTPQKGNIRINGISPAQFKEAEKRRTYGCVEQAFKATTGTIRDQITLKDPTITEEEIQKALEMVNLDTVVNQFDRGLDAPFDEKRFSQGQLQLLSVARATVANPKILLLDEMSANLDAIAEKEILDALKKVSVDKTVLSISHRTYTIGDQREIVIE